MKNIVLVILLVALTRAQQRYKLCAPFDTINEAACYALQKGEMVSCLRVEDSAECSIRLAEGRADFGIFNAEELILMYQFYQIGIDPIIELRHKQRTTESFEFQAVAVIRTDLTQIDIPPDERLKSLRNGGLCHPGFSETQWWNDYILKHFEKTVNPTHCKNDVTVIENEIRSLRDFFGKACRPGEWTSDDFINWELKRKYPQLCALCDNKANCTYNDMDHHGHLGALQCLARGDGKVAYVALSYVQKYLRTNETFQFLCPDGNVLPLSTPNPCAWVKQPWSVIAARKEIAFSLKQKLLEWLQPDEKEYWKVNLRAVIQEDSNGIPIKDTTSMADYLKERKIDLDTIDTCGKDIRWCTISDLETNKCKWVAKAAKALGVEPSISCIKSDSTFQCFRDISENRSDIIVIDSNYGHLARTVYGLSTVLYSETEMDRNSVILAVIREPKNDDYPVRSFHDLNGRKACFPEYGGISWLSFINIARTRGVISSKSCDYPRLVAGLLSGACTPGIEDGDHSLNITSSDISSKLCSACRHLNNTSCAVNKSNRYYGDRGAIQCINEGAGDIAFVEAANIIEPPRIGHHNRIDPNMYRILCKNGSLAINTGFNFDKYCALSETIDSEIVGRKNDSEKISMTNIVLALMKLENWLGYRVNVRRPIHIYGPFNNTLDLLFKDSTSGLLPTSSTKKSVLAYKELFRHLNECSNSGPPRITANTTFAALIALYSLFSKLISHY